MTDKKRNQMTNKKRWNLLRRQVRDLGHLLVAVADDYWPAFNSKGRASVTKRLDQAQEILHSATKGHLFICGYEEHKNKSR